MSNLRCPLLRRNSHALRSTKHMAERACHVFGSTTHVGLTQALGAIKAKQGCAALRQISFAGFGSKFFGKFAFASPASVGSTGALKVHYFALPGFGDFESSMHVPATRDCFGHAHLTLRRARIGLVGCGDTLACTGRHLRRMIAPNNSFKPNPFRSTNHMADAACHGVGSAARVGLTQALGAIKAKQGCAALRQGPLCRLRQQTLRQVRGRFTSFGVFDGRAQS